jgi:hypothetical protein
MACRPGLSGQRLVRARYPDGRQHLRGLVPDTDLMYAESWAMMLERCVSPAYVERLKKRYAKDSEESLKVAERLNAASVGPATKAAIAGLLGGAVCSPPAVRRQRNRFHRGDRRRPSVTSSDLFGLVGRVVHSAGYNLLSFTRASAVVNCQLALACLPLRSASHASTSSFNTR